MTMSFSKSFLEFLHQAKIKGNDPIPSEITYSVDQLFDLLLGDFLAKHAHQFSWSEMVPLIMSQCTVELPVIEKNEEEEVFMITSKEEEKVEEPELEKAPDIESDDDDDEYINPVRIISVKCIAPRCDQSFPTSGHLNYHLKNYHRIFEHRCLIDDCKYSSNNVSKLLKHQRIKHCGIEIWICRKCTKQFDYSSDLSDHLEMEHASGRFACGKANCKFEGMVRQVVKDHFRENHGGANMLMRPKSIKIASPLVDLACEYTTERITCTMKQCNSFFPTIEDFHKHLKVQHDLLPYLCLVARCRASFETSQQMESHALSRHSDVANWECSICHQEAYPEHALLYRHIFFSHKEGLYKCTASGCDQEGKFRQDIIEHYHMSHQVIN